jgi:integrase
MINVGARISDAAQLGRANVTQHEGKPWLRFTAFKNRNRFPSVIDVPMTPDLIEALAKSKAGDRAYLETGYGKPYVVKGLGNKMREWCDAAGLTHCSAHGLRKAAAVKMAESNVSAPELCAVFGWKNLSTAQVYIKKAENRRMAGNAFTRQHDYENSKSVSLLKPENADETKDGNSDE